VPEPRSIPPREDSWARGRDGGGSPRPRVQPATRRQALRRLDGGFEGCQLELRAEAGHPGVGEDGLGRLTGVKAGECLVAHDSAGAEIDDRLEDRVEGSLLDQLADGAPAAGLDPETTKPAGPSAMRAS
jgi:hypothetical protein